MQKISAIIITYNEESRIRFAIDSVQWCDEIIVIDSNSTDKTVEICKEYCNCKVYVHPFLGYGSQKKFGVEQASNDWILSIDADEIVSTALRDEIIVTLSQTEIRNAGFFLPITLIFMKTIFRFGCENKQFHLRLFNRNKGNFNTLNLHESVKVCGPVAKLKHEILHSSYTDIHHYFQKFNCYAEIYKNEALRKDKHISKLKAVVRFPVEFFKQYVLRKNFLNGYPGFVWSLFSAFYIFVKYTKLYEANLNK